MNEIRLLSQETIDKIAAGEVVERPSSVVKELVENAIDAGANAVTVEIREGGISLIRITDNGSGIVPDQVQAAFLRHATSKIRSVEDLLTAGTLGFRGEALSSIAAVSQVELITKTAGSLTGIRYCIEGGAEKSLEEIGAPEGTTFLVRNLFYNTPARKKFLKAPGTEAGYVSDLMERLALSHPEVSFKFMSNGQTKLHTSGNNNLKDMIYGIYGREIAGNLVKIDIKAQGLHIGGFIGKPIISRGNRNYENYFVNGRYVRSAILSKAIEEAYKPFMMSHRYPFTALVLTLDTEELDVNVHPTKMEVRFADQTGIYEQVYQAVKEGLVARELIPEISLDKNSRTSQAKEKTEAAKKYPEPFEQVRRQLIAESQSPYQIKYPQRPLKRPALEEPLRKPSADPGVSSKAPGQMKPVTGNIVPENIAPENIVKEDLSKETKAQEQEPLIKKETPRQETFFTEKLLDEKSVPMHKLIGQVFGTYWLVEFQDKLYIIDQHAAHEKVLYERFMRQLDQKQQTSQMISPPLVVTLNMQEEELLNKYRERFEELGFEIEPFGGREYSIRAVPGNLYGIADRELFLEILDGLSELSERESVQVIHEKLAMMSCKAAVKGNHTMSASEADALIGELLKLENPYNCPHGRPTIVSMTKYEMEKKFKRIV